ncbi:hypothetical protein AC578_2570 [Pseudocercospora eumusae]|uniref:Uncharacterized protein n=1 Tax=Pseudocercospora eumusae TaxID=321146 RepID=A0A139HHN2_9PEZI|nr:hypothetical protein AC578_2570 [Pseudocercospora eumusae]
MPIWHLFALLDKRPPEHALLPRFQCRKLMKRTFRIVFATQRPPRNCDPAPMSNIGNGTLLAYQIWIFTVAEMFVENTIQPLGLRLVPLDGIWYLLSRVSEEVIGLTLYRSHALFSRIARSISDP